MLTSFQLQNLTCKILAVIISLPVSFRVRLPCSLFLHHREKRGPLIFPSFLSLASHVSRCPCSPSQSEGLSLVQGLPLSPCTPHKDSFTKAHGTKKRQEWEPIKGIIGAGGGGGGEGMERKARWQRETDEKTGLNRKKRKRGGQIESVGKASGAKLDGPGEETVN